MGSVLGFPGVDPVDAAVGARLRRWREMRGMALDEFAAAIQSPPEDIRRAEVGRARLTTAQIGAATSVLHLPLWALVSDERAY